MTKVLSEKDRIIRNASQKIKGKEAILSDVITDAIKSKGMSQSDICRRLNLCRQTVAKAIKHPIIYGKNASYIAEIIGVEIWG